MSIYNNSINTRVLEAVNFNQNRAEFRLDNDQLYLSNLRLINVGFSSAGGLDGGGTRTEVRYNCSAGNLCVIKNIELYSGNQLLDQIVDFNLWSVYNGTNRDNDYNASIARNNDNTALGFTTNTESVYQEDDYPTLDGSVIETLGGLGTSLSLSAPLQDNLLSSSWVNLQDILEFLRQSLHIPTKILRNVRLVINFVNKNEMRDLCAINSANGLIDSISVYQPLLIVDMVEEGNARDSLERGYKGVSYDCMEFDRAVLPEETTATDTINGNEVQQVKTFLMNGFNNKYVSSMVVIPHAVDRADNYSEIFDSGRAINAVVGNYGAKPFWKPEYQVRINGANKLVGSRKGGKNRCMAMTTDTIGTLNYTPFSNLIAVAQQEQIADEDSVNQVNNNNNYFAIPIEEYINEFQLTFSRTAVYNNANINGQTFISVMGKVRKTLVVNPDGSFNISY